MPRVSGNRPTLRDTTFTVPWKSTLTKKFFNDENHSLIATLEKAKGAGFQVQLAVQALETWLETGEAQPEFPITEAIKVAMEGDEEFEIFQEALRRVKYPGTEANIRRTAMLLGFDLFIEGFWSQVTTDSTRINYLATMHPRRPALFTKLLQDVEDVNVAGDEDETLLHVCASKGSVDYLNALFERQANPNAVDSEGQTPFHVVCASEGEHRVEVAKLILDRGGKVAPEKAKDLLDILKENTNKVEKEQLAALLKGEETPKKDSEGKLPGLFFWAVTIAVVGTAVWNRKAIIQKVDPYISKNLFRRYGW